MGLIGFIIGAIFLLIEVLGGVILTNELTGMTLQLVALFVLTLLGIAALVAIATDRRFGWPILLLTFCGFVVDFIALYMLGGSSLSLVISLVTGALAIIFSFIGVDLWHPHHDLSGADRPMDEMMPPKKVASTAASKKRSKKSSKRAKK